MSYAVVNCFYGLPLSASWPPGSGRSEMIEYMIEGEEEGFHAFYSSSADYPPAAFGVDLKARFDECTHHTEISELRIEATDEEKQQYQDLFNNLDPEVQEHLKPFGSPRVFLLWSSS